MGNKRITRERRKRSTAKRRETELTARDYKELAALEKLHDSPIDLSDIPEITDWSGAEIGRFYRPARHTRNAL